MGPRLSERLAAKEAALFQEAIARSAADRVAIQSSGTSIAMINTTETSSPSSSVPAVPRAVDDVFDIKSQESTARPEVDDEMNGTLAASELAIQDAGDLTSGAPAQSRTQVTPAVGSPPAMTFGAVEHVGSVSDVTPAAVPDPFETLDNPLSPLLTGSSMISSLSSDGEVDPERQAQGNSMAKPATGDDVEEQVTQTRHLQPKRSAVTAAGRHRIEEQAMTDSKESHLTVQTPQKTPAKRKRGVVSRASTSPAGKAMDFVQDASDSSRAAKTTQKKQKSTVPAISKRMTKNAQGARLESDADLFAVLIAVDDDEKDEDFSPTIRKAQKTSGERKQYSFRRREETELVVKHIKQEAQDTSAKQVAKSVKNITTKTTKKAVKKESRPKSTKDVLRGRQTTKQRKDTKSKANVSQLPDSAKKLATKKKIVRIKGDFTNTYKVKFGSTPFSQNTRPSKQHCHKVFDILKKHHERDDVKFERYPEDNNSLPNNDVQGPMHAAEDVVFHAIVKTILSQATNNENALTAETTLIHRFRYDFLGVKVKGTSPNYHLMRKTPQPVLAKALIAGGLHNMKANLILGCLSHVYDCNFSRASDEEKLRDEKMGESFDFVPGMLSLDYMKPWSLQDKFDHLVSMPGVGVKTAACILSFSFEYPVFAVDTHVLRLSRILRWLPLHVTNVDHAFMHLDKRVPDELKYGLHQAFWHHGQACIRCRAGTDENTKGWKETKCPIEHLVKRSLKDLPKAKNSKSGDDDEKPKKPKKPKQRPTVYPYVKLTPEKAEELGYELRSITIDDGFGVRRANFRGKVVWKWVLKSDHDAIEHSDPVEAAEEMGDGGEEAGEDEDSEWDGE
jgi:endonuclease III